MAAKLKTAALAVALLAFGAATAGAKQLWELQGLKAPESVVVDVAAGVAYLHLPLTLVIGAAARPDRLRFLVSLLGVETAQGWRIAALFTTSEKAPAVGP